MSDIDDFYNNFPPLVILLCLITGSSIALNNTVERRGPLVTMKSLDVLSFTLTMLTVYCKVIRIASVLAVFSSFNTSDLFTESYTVLKSSNRMWAEISNS